MGALGMICGIWLLTLPAPQLTVTFIYVIGFYLVFAAVNGICDACTFYGYSRDWFGWILALLLIMLLFAIIFIAGPIAGGVAVWLYIGISFIVYGIYRMFVAAKIRRVNRIFSK